MKIDCYLSLRCGSEDALRGNIYRAIELEGTDADVNFYRITDEEAQKLSLRGSPSILINGMEVQPADITGFS